VRYTALKLVQKPFQDHPATQPETFPIKEPSRSSYGRVEKLRELYANTNSILNKLYRATLPDSNVTSMLPGHGATSRQLDQMLASSFIIFNPSQLELALNYDLFTTGLVLFRLDNNYITFNPNRLR